MATPFEGKHSETWDISMLVFGGLPLTEGGLKIQWRDLTRQVRQTLGESPHPQQKGEGKG